MATFITEPLVGVGTPDFAAGWNACLANAPATGSSDAYHSGWMSCCREAANRNGSFIGLEPLVYVKPRDFPIPNPFKRWL